MRSKETAESEDGRIVHLREPIKHPWWTPVLQFYVLIG